MTNTTTLHYYTNTSLSIRIIENLLDCKSAVGVVVYE
ncbi:hypothetical protein HATV-3_gp65 [Haloarcula tailed virus 3]|uniref:Uncharacterized protein n=1 Tax=Haloarcula tailed virus 3 TaxID=2877990 RepID=A0AAE8XZ77_9CAUD|nr:hypothetical protein M1M35_gp65 [Haloarcula tailed virus 3]UBF23415.1 hypothetical protein HATV-3_gp65 [Haloarcula tailed virus 3]